MNIGIVTTWFERGAAYVSKQFEDVLSKKYNVYIYARGGERYAKGDPKWDKENVTWGRRTFSPFSGTTIKKKDFIKWLIKNNIDVVIFNEQQWWIPLLWCNERKIPTIAYIDYYKSDTISLFAAYSSLICNTKRHYSVFKWHRKSFYLPWGTDISIYKPLSNDFKLVNTDFVTFFHSAGYSPRRKGTDILIKAASGINEKFKLIIHSQIDLLKEIPEVKKEIEFLFQTNRLEIINKTVSAPGLYYLGDVYIYPSRLEGIGLTIAEAQASGLVPVVTNNAPMNEFVNNEIGYLIDLEDCHSRPDGYYWPECIASVKRLKEIMIHLITEKEKIPILKEMNRKFALEYLNWEKNSVQLTHIIDKSKYIPIDELVKLKIIRYEHSGLKKLNKIFLNHYWFMKIARKLIKFL